MPHLARIKIAGYKSIREQEIELGALNVLIGANGAGKSNFIGVFRLLHEIVNERLQVFTAREGGADRFLHFGGKTTEKIALHFWFGQNQYACTLEPASSDALIFGAEYAYFQGEGFVEPFEVFSGVGARKRL